VLYKKFNTKKLGSEEYGQYLHQDCILVLHSMQKEPITMAKLVNGWAPYSEVRYEKQKSMCQCSKEETWEHVVTCSENKELTAIFIGQIGEVNLKSVVPVVCKTVMHKGLRNFLCQVHSDFTAGESVYAEAQGSSGWKYLFHGLMCTTWVETLCTARSN